MYISHASVKQVTGFAGVVGGQPIDVEDSVAAALAFDNGTFGVMTCGYYLESGYQDSIRMWGERGWLHYWRTGSFTPDLSPTDIPDLPSIAAAWASLEQEEADFARELTEEKLRASCPVDDDPYALSELIQHILNHSTHHRGQVVHMLRELGRTPPGTGFRQFLTEKRSELARG